MAMDFSWEAMAGNLQANAFNEKKSYKNETDSRFWKLSRDENGNGGALIRFLPDMNGVPFVTLSKIRAQNKDGKGFFVNEWSPTSIGLPDPFDEEFSKLWKAGEKDTAKTLGRSIRFITNIYVVKDPANEENNGKVFLYDMSQSMMEMIKEVMIQTESMKALDEEPIAVYNPVEGNNFLIKVKDGTNGIPTYESSKFADKVTGIFADEAEATAAIAEKTYALKEFLEPSNFKTYEELTDLLNRFMKRDGKGTEKGAEKGAETPAETPAETKKPAETTPAKETVSEDVTVTPAETASVDDADLDDLLNEITQ